LVLTLHLEPFSHTSPRFISSQPPFNTEINPNGRVPAIHDPNTDLKLWESGAIISYLISQYDKDNKLSYKADDLANSQHSNQWLHFQMSGQGPYFGQAVWFQNYHSEKIPSAIERYQKEVDRVCGVLDAHLAAAGTPYLVGDLCTYADLSFVPWFNMLTMILGEDGNKALEKKLPHYAAWYSKLCERESVKKINVERAAIAAASS
jgi:glutathione S-transferase